MRQHLCDVCGKVILDTKFYAEIGIGTWDCSISNRPKIIFDLCKTHADSLEKALMSKKFFD